MKLWYKDYKGYTGVETGSENAGQVAEKLQAETFATDPNYADKLKKIPVSYTHLTLPKKRIV